ncbi:LysR substrate-binding domain-containing protein [Pseudochelatococcus lubricantis]
MRQCYRRMFTHRQIEIFRAVMTHGTVSAAADALHISQPAASRLIRDLEQHLGMALFERSHGRVNPTPGAFDLLEEVNRFFISLDQVERTAKDIAHGRRVGLVVASMPALATTVVADAMRIVLERHLDLSIRIMSVTTISALRMISSQAANIGIASPYRDISGLIAIRQLAVPYMCILPHDHELASRPAVTLKDLERYPFIGYSKGTASAELIERLVRENGLDIRSRIDVHLSQMVSSFVLRDLGIAIVDAFTAREHIRAGGEARPIDIQAKFGFSIVMREMAKMTRIEHEFISAVETLTAALEAVSDHG